MRHNSNGRDGEMNQTLPRPSPAQFPIEFKQKVFQVENSLKYWNIKDSQWLSDTGFLSPLYEVRKSCFRTINRK